MAPLGHVLPASTIASLVRRYFETADRRPWSRFTSFPWKELRPELLDDTDRFAVVFISFIEDHLPGYFSELMRRHPTDGSVSLEEYERNRELYRFLIRWAEDEDRHAHLLFEYQVRAGIDDAAALRRSQAEEGRKTFTFGYDDPAQTFTYTLLQEKATQIFYQTFARKVREPILRSILEHLARDESQHFAFYAALLRETVIEHGVGIYPSLQEVVREFKMPLATTLKNYWRWSLGIAGSLGYDHTQAYGELERIVQKAASAASDSKATDALDFLQSLGRLSGPKAP